MCGVRDQFARSPTHQLQGQIQGGGGGGGSIMTMGFASPFGGVFISNTKFTINFVLLECLHRVSLFTGLDYWTGLLDSKFTHKISFPVQLQPPKAIVSPHLKQCPSLGHQDTYLVQCNQSIVATYPSNCRGALGR